MNCFLEYRSLRSQEAGRAIAHYLYRIVDSPILRDCRTGFATGSGTGSKSCYKSGEGGKDSHPPPPTTEFIQYIQRQQFPFERSVVAHREHHACKHLIGCQTSDGTTILT